MMSYSMVQNHLLPFKPSDQQLLGNDKPWLQKTRQAALEFFLQHGMPTTRQEDWKYTRLSTLAQQNYQTASPTAFSRSDMAQQFIPNLAGFSLVFIDGHYQAHLSTLENLPTGVTLCELSSALSTHADLLRSHLAQIAATHKHGLHALNTAFMQTGYFLHIPAGTTLTKPIEILFLATEQSQPVNYQLRNLVIAEPNAQACLLEHYAAPSSHHYWTNTLTEISLAEQAKFEHVKLQRESLSAYHTGTLTVRQAAHSEITCHSFALGGRLVRSDTDVLQAAEHAHCSLNGFYLAQGKQHIDHHTCIDHAKPYGSSRELYKGIITDQARAVFNGKVIVRQDAQKIDASQTNKNLLLADGAEIDTKPELEIYADDVRCAHGATIGQLNADELFYLRARGLDEKTASALLTFGFANELLDFISQDALRHYLRLTIAKLLSQDVNFLEVI